ADPWVILADITLTGSGKITEQHIKMPPHRRYIAAFGEFYFVCKPGLIVQPGRRTEVEYRVARAGLEEMVNVAGLRAVEETMENDLTRITELAVTDLRGVDERSKLGQQLVGMKIAEVAALPLDEFINGLITEDMNSTSRASLRRQATEIHNRAKRVERISTDLKG
ncbi:MAG: hypothetical protein K8I82_21620, partial [Anaerolineae bacterium]|nr:hypothetical protein [Anaerolineae bacterium]